MLGMLVSFTREGKAVVTESWKGYLIGQLKSKRVKAINVKRKEV